MTAFAEYIGFDGTGLAQLIAQGEVCATEVLAAAAARIEALNPALNAIISHCALGHEEALARAERTAPLYGVPMLLKDFGAVEAGVPFSNGSRLAGGGRPLRDSVLVARYRTLGLVSLGRTNTPEFGLSVTTEPLSLGATRNPWHTDLSPGGSSGGSAAAVAAGLVPIAHGTDGAGSLRIPASCCGVFGLKPTRGRISLAPHAAEVWAGCMVEHVVTRTVRDSALVLQHTAGPERGDTHVAPPLPADLVEVVQQRPRTLRIGLAQDAWNGARVDPICAAAAVAAAEACARLGHEVREGAPIFDARSMERNFNRMLVVQAAREVRVRAAALGRALDPSLLEPATWAVVRAADRLTSWAYVDSVERMRVTGRQFSSFFETFDMLITPTLAQPPWPLGQLTTACTDADHYLHGLWQLAPFTYPANVTGQPAASLPLALSDAGLPVGVQLIARFGDEATLLALSRQLEEVAGWPERLPPSAFRPPLGRGACPRTSAERNVHTGNA